MDQSWARAEPAWTSRSGSPDIRWRMLMEYLLYICIAHTDSKEKSDMFSQKVFCGFPSLQPTCLHCLYQLDSDIRLCHSHTAALPSSPLEWCSCPSGTISCLCTPASWLSNFLLLPTAAVALKLQQTPKDWRNTDGQGSYSQFLISSDWDGPLRYAFLMISLGNAGASRPETILGKLCRPIKLN